jgi:hypothetical protein
MKAQAAADTKNGMGCFSILIKYHFKKRKSLFSILKLFNRLSVNPNDILSQM